MTTVYERLQRGAACILFVLSFLFSLHSGAQSNTAISMNGNSSTGPYVDLGTVAPSGNFSTGLTIECWAKWGAFNNWSRLLDLGNGSGSDNILLANSGYTQSIRFEVYRGAGTNGVTGPSLVTGRWYHIAVTQTTSGLATIYVDGVPVVSGTVNQPVNVARARCYIGRSNWATDGYLDGSVDEMRIWNVARSASEIKQYMFKPVAANATGLVAWYKCDEGSGTVLSNACTAGVAGDGAVTGSLTWITSPAQYSGNAVDLDGANDYVSIGTPLPSGSSYTKEAWIYQSDNSGSRNVVSSNGSPLWIDNGTLRAGNNGVTALVSDASPLPTNTWVHVAVTYDATTGAMKLYRDGALVASGTSAQAYTGGASYIGAWHNGTALESYLAGKIDEVRIWNVVRSATEISANRYRELNPAAEGSLVAYYTFNQGIQTGANTGMITVIDQKGTFNGTLTNLALSGTASNFVEQQGTLVVLPVRLLSFSAQKSAKGIHLQWSTASEQNASDFVVQHSTDGNTWTNIATIAAAGNSSTVTGYGYTHATPVAGNNFYRLLQRDRDGKSAYSPVRTVSLTSVTRAFSLRGNVVTNNLLGVDVQSTTTLSLFTRDGRLLWIKKLEAGRHTVEAGPLAKGLYYLKGEGVTERVMIL